MEITGRSNKSQRFSTWIGALLICGIGTGLWIYGVDYYALPFAKRPAATLHAQLGSGRSIGHGLGIVGTAMLLLMLLYSLRKRLSFLQRVGTLRQWLSLHIFFGLMGPLLITFHTGFKIGGLVSIAYWSMIITMLSGIFGRYIYAQLPHNSAGDQLSPQDLQEEEEQLRVQIEDLLDGDGSLIRQIHSAAPRSTELPDNGWLALINLVRQDLGRLFSRRRLHEFLRKNSNLPNETRRQVVALALRRAVVSRRKSTFHIMDPFFRYWHVLHRPFVWIMFAIVAVHIAVALLFGYTGV